MQNGDNNASQEPEATTGKQETGASTQASPHYGVLLSVQSRDRLRQTEPGAFLPASDCGPFLRLQPPLHVDKVVPVDSEFLEF